MNWKADCTEPSAVFERDDVPVRGADSPLIAKPRKPRRRQGAGEPPDNIEHSTAQRDIDAAGGLVPRPTEPALSTGGCRWRHT